MEKTLRELEVPLYRFLLRLTGDEHAADDLTQETLLRGWRQRDTLRERRAAKVWLFRIAVNLCRDQHRRSQSKPKHRPWQEPPGPTPPPSEIASANELGRLVWETIDLLPDRQRDVMHLRMLEEMEPKEIAATLGLTAPLVRSHLAAARKKLRTQLALTGLVPEKGDRCS